MYTTFLQIGLASFISLSTLGAQISPNLTPGLAGAALELLDKQPVVIHDNQLASVISIEDLIEVKARINGLDPEILKKIAACESNMRQYDSKGKVLEGRENSGDKGLFQVHAPYHEEDAEKQGYDIYTTDGNLGWAIKLYKEQGTRPWNPSKACWGKHLK